MDQLESLVKTRKLIQGLIVTVVAYIILAFCLIQSVGEELKIYFWILEGMLCVFLFILLLVAPSLWKADEPGSIPGPQAVPADKPKTE
jgi:hypothetical protein